MNHGSSSNRVSDQEKRGTIKGTSGSNEECVIWERRWNKKRCLFIDSQANRHSTVTRGDYMMEKD